MIHEATEILGRKIDLSYGQMEAVMEEIMTGKAQTAEIVSFLTALNLQGETQDEIIAAVKVMRRHATKVQVNKAVILDTCGTGGDKKGTFNVSTAVAFVASGCGVCVAKHGNRAVSSSCGSADILEALGININMNKEQIELCLNEVGIGFLFAPNFHPAMKYAMPARKLMATKTIFNILGPLTNPAGATHQLVGVYEPKWTEILARVLGNLGTEHALVVHGEDGLDEVSISTKTFISEAHKDKILNYQISPEDLGLEKAEPKDLAGGSAMDNARIIMEILKGKLGPRRDIVILNAAVALYTADKAKEIKEGITLASESIDSGNALIKLDLLKDYSHQAK